MMYLKLLYQSFYDLSAIRNYIKNGKGTGIVLMFFVAVAMFVGTSTSSLKNFSKLDLNEIEYHISEGFKKLPPIVIRDGELVWEDGVIEHFQIAKDFSIIINTQDEAPSYDDIPEKSIYLTKTDLYIRSDRKLKTVSFAEILEASEENEINLTSPEVEKFISKLIRYSIVSFIIIAGISMFLFYWLMSGILASITRTIAVKSVSKLKDVEYFEIRRTAAVATLPIMILITISQAVFAQPTFMVKALIIIVLGIFLMSKIYINNENETKEVTQ